MNNIGALYQNGYGLPQNTVIAMTWHHKAAVLGSDLARLNMARVGAAVLIDVIKQGFEDARR